MPIFSNRSTLRMLNAITPVIGNGRRGDLLARLVRNDEGSLASEWEIAVLYCLWRQGSIRPLKKIEDQSDPDIIYKSKQSGLEVVVEVTALSDRSLDDRNPIDDFGERLRKEFSRLDLGTIGGLIQSIGHTDSPDGPILAIPVRRDFDSFFSAKNFKSFMRKIKSDPLKKHSLSFPCRRGNSRLDYIPGCHSGHSGYIFPKVVTNIAKNHLYNRLRQKDKQLKGSGIELPAIVIVCDAHCHFMSSTMNGSGNVSASDVADFFLNGRKHIELGPWMVQKGAPQRSRSINAVQLWTLRDESNFARSGPEARTSRVHIVPNRGETDHALGAELYKEVADSRRYLPPIISLPAGALRIKRRPYFYGVAHMSFDKSRPLKVKLSLLSVQKLISGELASEHFSKEHEDAVRFMKNASVKNRIISNVRIEKQKDRDDDWMELTFGEVDPNQLFQEEIERSKQAKLLPFWRRVAFRMGKSLIDLSGVERW